MFQGTGSRLAAQLLAGQPRLQSWLTVEAEFRQRVANLEKSLRDAVRAHPSFSPRISLDSFVERHCFELISALPRSVIKEHIKLADKRDRCYRDFRPHLLAAIRYATAVTRSVDSLGYLIEIGEGHTDEWNPARVKQASAEFNALISLALPSQIGGRRSESKPTPGFPVAAS